MGKKSPPTSLNLSAFEELDHWVKETKVEKARDDDPKQKPRKELIEVVKPRVGDYTQRYPNTLPRGSDILWWLLGASIPAILLVLSFIWACLT